MTSDQNAAPKRADIAILGTGIMGSAMARNLVAAGLPTTVWDRSPEATAPLVVEGAVAAASVPDAIRDARVVSRLGRVRPDVTFVDAPVSGSKGPAEAGQLLILASGPATAEPVTAAVFDAIGRKTVWLGAAGQGSRMKLVVNTYLSFLIEGVAEALELGRRLGIDPVGLDAVLEGGPLDAPLADAKLHKIARGDVSAARLALGGRGQLPVVAAG
jgi:3-hydroxyisobutyrate dehydrogenase